MSRPDDSATDSALLREVADWQDHPAWHSFQHRYDPLIRRWCRRRGLDGDSVDEVCQRIWIELTNRMRTFRYDPTRSFRGWLRRLCTSRVVDFLRRRRDADEFIGLDTSGAEEEREQGRSYIESPVSGDGEAEPDPARQFLLDQAAKAQDAVRRRIRPRTWDAFWLVIVRDWTVARTAKTLDMTHAAVYAAVDRVNRMLLDEGRRARRTETPEAGARSE